MLKMIEKNIFKVESENDYIKFGDIKLYESCFIDLLANYYGYDDFREFTRKVLRECYLRKIDIKDIKEMY